MINTSNLTDHLRALNLLVLIALLLKSSISAILYIEKLLKLSTIQKDLIANLIDSHLPTLLALLGLILVKIIISASAILYGDNCLLDIYFSKELRDRIKSIRQQFMRLT
jgi:hypothetical protein